ncbi:hypothetical protein GBA52_016133 [Prunus armeniaca]|nr:hypothetical protein GBA52_016133 [Prunus armeniaca]
MEKTECSEAENFGFATTSLEPQATAKRKKNKSKNQRRFSDEQIRLLESIVEAAYAGTVWHQTGSQFWNWCRAKQ